MSTTALTPATTPIPVQLSEPEFTAFLFPHLSMPKRGPKCKLGSYRALNLILRVLYTGMQWKCLPIPHDAQGKPVIHDTTIDQVFATWADDGSRWPALVARGRHLAAEPQLDLGVLHGDGTHTVAKKGGRALGAQGIHTRRGTKTARSSTTLGMSERLCPWLLAMKQIGCCCPRASKRGKKWRQRSGETAEGPLAISMAALIRRTIGRASSRPVCSPTSPRTLATASAPSAGASGGSPRPFLRYACVASAPVRGRIHASVYGFDVHVSSGGIMG
jgi:transposase